MTTMWETSLRLAVAPGALSSRAARDTTPLWITMLLRLPVQTRRYCCLTFRTVSLTDAWDEMERITLGQTRDQIAGTATTSRPTLLNDVTVLDFQRRPPRDCA